MNARDEILQRIREATRDADTSAVPVPRGYRTPAGGHDLLARFVERVEDYRATVTRCTAADVAATIEKALQGAGRVIVPGGFPWPVAGGAADERLTPLELDGYDAVVTTATVGIAETGTLVLTHGQGEGRRALSLVPDLHVCVIGSSRVVADVPQAVAALDPQRPQTWISGPSATSDIELNRVEGVHGPRSLHVVVVDDA